MSKSDPRRRHKNIKERQRAVVSKWYGKSNGSGGWVGNAGGEYGLLLERGAGLTIFRRSQSIHRVR
jgi:hypothetical protein